MYISSYEDLLNAANKQDEPQRLLFVFTSAELPDELAKGQEEQFEVQKGGMLTPVKCADKLAGELGAFASLVEESIQAETNWDIVFAAGMSGKSGIAPSSKDAEQHLKVWHSLLKMATSGVLLPLIEKVSYSTFTT